MVFSRLLLLACLLVAATAYVALLVLLDMQVRTAEIAFGAGADTPDRLDIELELHEIDAVRREATLRVTVVPSETMRGARASAPNTDFLLVLRIGDEVQDLAFPANQRMPTTDLRIDLEHGSILQYPFDRYDANMRWRAFRGTPTQRGAPIPIRLITYETSAAFDVPMREAKLSSPGDVTVALNARRPVMIRWFASAILVSMVAVAISALAIGGLMFTRRRRVEAALLGALCAMMFAVPVMRNTLPGAPPLGVAADLLIFLWAEVSVVIGLMLGVASWARDAARPGVS